jgi:hypothetical protein
VAAVPMPVATRSKAWVCGRSNAGIVGLNPARVMALRLLYLLCVVRQTSLRRADHSSRGVLPTVVCLSAIPKPQQRDDVDASRAVAPQEGEKKNFLSPHLLPAVSIKGTPLSV